MRRKSIRPYLILGAFLLALTALSMATADGLRGGVVRIFSSFWGPVAAKDPGLKEEVERLKLENHLLRDELKKAKPLLNNPALGEKGDVVAAKVVFRSPTAWESSLWIDVGSETQRKGGKQIVAKDSPVLIGKSLIGVVDYIGKKQSRVRLITDSGLSPSVRAVRRIDGQPVLLAKGILHGHSQPQWRRSIPYLRGEGFNYDFADEAGPARDLKSGVPAGQEGTPIAILREGDFLLTTGMDGVFPAGLMVAKVVKVDPLKEGDFAYELDAVPTAGSLEEISYVLVIPPVGYDAEDRPPG